MKRRVIAGVAMIMVIGMMMLVSCSNAEGDPPDDPGTGILGEFTDRIDENAGDEDGTINITDEDKTRTYGSWTKFDSLDEAVKESGIEINVPAVGGWEFWYAESGDKAVSAVYDPDNNFEDGNIVYRKCASEKVATSDYEEFPFICEQHVYSEILKVDGTEVVITGESRDVINRAVWKNGDYWYSIGTQYVVFDRTSIQDAVRGLN